MAGGADGEFPSSERVILDAVGTTLGSSEDRLIFKVYNENGSALVLRTLPAAASGERIEAEVLSVHDQCPWPRSAPTFQALVAAGDVEQG